MYEGWKWREERHIDELKQLHELRMREYSILASWLTAPHLKKPMKPTDFYSPDKKEKVKTTPDESKRILDELQKEMG